MPRKEDFTQVARRVVDQATGEGKTRKNPAAVELGRMGGNAKAAKDRARREAEQQERESA
jgi:hypothetical protein